MPLTPIKVRGKNRKPTTKPVSKLRGRGRPLKSETNSPASNTDAELDSRHGSDGNRKKRRKTRHARTLAPLENLPTEILQNVFFLSRNADLMFASKAIMHKLERSEHVKIEFCFSTLFWPIINGEVDPNLNARAEPMASAGEGNDDDDDDEDGEGGILGRAQSRLLSCRFFTRQFFSDYLVKAYEKWNNLHATSNPDRIVEIPPLNWALPADSTVQRTIGTIDSVCELPLTPARSLPEGLDSEAQKFRLCLVPTAFHPSARIPVKFFRNSAYNLKSSGGAQYQILTFLRRGLRMRMPATGDGFDDLMRDMARAGNPYLMEIMLWFRVWEPTVTGSLPSDILRILVIEGGCPSRIVDHITRPSGHEKARTSSEALLDPAVWAWAEKNGEYGEVLKEMLKGSLTVLPQVER